MATVTYHSQPGIHATRGAVGVAGNKHPYQVSKVLWPNEVESYLASRLIGYTLHVCCGLSRLGDVRADLYQPDIDVRVDAARLPFADKSFDTVLIDPPYNGVFQWNHDMLNELHRLARKRILFQHWFAPINSRGQFKKAHVFHLTETAVVVEEVEDSEVFVLTDLRVWQPRTYFGRVQLIAVLDYMPGESQISLLRGVK